MKRNLVCASDKNEFARFQDYLSLSTTLIMILTTGTLASENCIKALELATIKNKKIIVVHDTTSPFPQYSDMQKLPKGLRHIFSTIAVPLATEHLSTCWSKINDKIFERLKVQSLKKYKYWQCRRLNKWTGFWAISKKQGKE